MIRPLITDSPSRPPIVVSDSIISAAYSGGPKLSATLASVGAINIRPITLTVPAMNDAIAAMPSAWPARPWRASWWPSMQVITAVDSPGRFIRIAVVEPPYWAP